MSLKWSMNRNIGRNIRLQQHASHTTTTNYWSLKRASSNSNCNHALHHNKILFTNYNKILLIWARSFFFENCYHNVKTNVLKVFLDYFFEGNFKRIAKLKYISCYLITRLHFKSEMTGMQVHCTHFQNTLKSWANMLRKNTIFNYFSNIFDKVMKIMLKNNLIWFFKIQRIVNCAALSNLNSFRWNVFALRQQWFSILELPLEYSKTREENWLTYQYKYLPGYHRHVKIMHNK